MFQRWNHSMRDTLVQLTQLRSALIQIRETFLYPI